MNEEYILKIYSGLGGEPVFGKYDDFKDLMSNNEDYASKIYNGLGGESVFGKYDDFRSLTKSVTLQPLKKKEDTTALPSEVGSSVSPVSAEPEMAKFGYQPGKPLPEQIPSVQPDQPVQTEYTEEVMIGPMGISGVKTTGRAQEFQGKSIPKVVGELGKVLAKGIIKFPADVVETAAIASAAAKNLVAKTGLVDETTATQVTLPTLGAGVNFFQAASEWKNLVDDFIPTDKDIESGFWGQTANALGQMVPILLTGGMSGGGRAIAKEAGKKGLSMQAVANYGKDIVSRIGTAQGAITISQVAAPSYEQAKLEGATENEALGYAIQNAVMTFPLEMLPVSNLFKRLDNVLVGNTGVEVLKRAVVGGVEEGVTEGIQNIYENVTADAIYGTTREFLDGVGEASAVGGTVGAIMNGLLTALLGRRARAKSDKEIEEIDKSIKDVEQKIAQVESNNESINETVKALEENKLRKLSYGSADYNFIESPEGALEYADDALTEQQAQGIVGNLANSYKKIDFTIEEVEPEDPYQPTTYKIIGTPKTIQQDAIQEQAAGEVPVQSGATVSQEVEEGAPQAEPQVTAEAVVQEEVVTPILNQDIEVKSSEGRKGLVPVSQLEEFIGEDRLGEAQMPTSRATIDRLKEDIAKNGFKEPIVLVYDRLSGEGEATIIEGNHRIIAAKELGLKEVPVIFEKGTIRTDESRVKNNMFPIKRKTIGDIDDTRGITGSDLGLTVRQPTDADFVKEGKVQEVVTPEVAAPSEIALVVAPSPEPTIQTEEVTPEVSVQPEVTPSVSPTVAPAPEAAAAVAPEPTTEPITITDIKINFAPENAIEVEKGTREDTTGRKFTYNAAVTSQATDQNGNPIGTMTKRSNEDGVLSFTIKDVNGRNINKGKSYPTERDARMALAEQVNRVRARATPAAKPAEKKARAISRSTVSKKNKREEIISRPAFTPITLARQWLLSGGKLRSKQSEEDRRRGVGVGKGVREETGMGGVEMRKLFSVIDNKKGLSIEVAAERIYNNLDPELQESMDVQDIRNAIIEVLLSEDIKTWEDNQDRETSESQMSELDQFMYNQLSDDERAEFDEYQQTQSYYNYLSENSKQLAKEYDEYVKSKTYQDYIEEIYGRDRESQTNAQNQDDGRGQKQGTDGETDSVQRAEREAEAAEVDDIINEDKGTLESALDFLEGLDKKIDKALKTRANDALLGIPLTAFQGMVKGLKALVQGGMKLRDAIKKIAEENNISQDKLKELLNLMPIQEEFNALLAKADALIARQKSKNIEDKRILSNAETMLRKEPAYINATDAQRKIMEREVRAKMGAEPRKAASIGRVLGALKDITNVTREEKLKIISRIRELGRDVAKDLAAEIRAMANGGTITTKQAGDIIARFGKVNMLNEISVSNFVEYMSKVLANAEYVAQLETAKSARKKLRSLSKDKKKSANLRDLAAKFVDIDPTMVEDIDAYNKVAKKIKESVEGSSIKGKDVKFADIVKEGAVVPYIDETLKAQNEKLYQERLKEAKDILGIDAKDLTYDELLVLLSEGKEKEKQEIRFSFENLDTNELINTIINAFDVYSSILESSIRTGVDPFTGEQVAYTDTQKKLISEFIKMDLNILSPKQALEAVDSLLNFIQNNSTAKMESILRAYQGEANVRGLVEDKVKASPLRKYWSKPLGRILGEQLTNLDLLIEKMFKGFRQGLKIAKDMGLTDIKNGKSQAVSESNKIVNEYVSQFYDKKANGEVFNTDFNDVERGMTAFMMRNVIGTEAEMKAEFNRRKQLVKESIDELAQGDEREASYSEIYQQVYDKILKDAKTIDDVTSKVDNVNLDAVKFWQSKWSDKYEELSDVSLNVYNKVLEKDINYTPDRQSKLSTDNDPVEISTDDMVFHSNNGTIYKKETGVLMEATRPKALPKNPNTGLPSRYISLSFDKNNSNAMYDALVDIKTAGPIRQAEAFVNSKSFRKLVTQAEDAKILKDRIRLYVNNIRNKNPYSNDEVSKLLRGLNSVASIGVGQALGGVFQPIKQMIPVGVNTLINAKGFDMGSMFDKAKQEFLNNSGYGIASRGAESQAQIESLNNLIKKASESKGDRAIRLLEEANKLQLKIFLVKPDAYIARASWMTYYEQELNRLGIDPNTIDYTTHKINKKAADYAEAMVNRQQNVSDADLAGKLLGERSDEKQMFVKLLMPFASFRMNQSARVGADVGTFLSKTATKEDKAIAARSLSGFAAEMVTFRAISVGTGLVISAISGAIMGSDEEDNEKKKDSIIKGQLTSTVGDVFSPIPYTDKFIQSGVAGALDIVQDAMDIDEEDRLTIFSGRNQELLESLGLFGISLARGAQFVELIQLSTTGSYKDNFGKKKYISDDSKKTLRLLIGPALLTNTGLLPVEVNSVIRSSISAAKKKSSTKEGGPSIPDKKGMTKTEIKKSMPTLYKEIYGETDEMMKEIRKEQKEILKESGIEYNFEDFDLEN